MRAVDGPARYALVTRAEVLTDIAALAAHGREVVAAASAVLADLAHGRVMGKQLGERHVSGDLTGLARVKFDLPGQRPQRFRLLYRDVDEITRQIVAIGERDQHAIYRTAVARLSR